MSTTAGHDTPLATGPHHNRMCTFALVVGGVGLGLAATVGLDPGLVFAGYTVGLGVLLLCLGLLLPERPEDAGGSPDRSCPRPD